MSAHFRLGLAQLNSTDNFSRNLEAFESAYARAGGVTGENEPAELVVFPENSLWFRIRSKAAPFGHRLEGPELSQIAGRVAAVGVPVLLTTPLRESGAAASLTNATIHFEPGRQPKIVYRKIHLFDVQVPGAPPVRESDSFVSGRRPAVVEVAGWTFGLSICYDLRFPELYLNYAQKVDVLLVPSAFLVPTGQAHCEVLLRARAIESQCFVAAPAQVGTHRSSEAEGEMRETFGHSLIIDPWGVPLARLATSPGVSVVNLDRAALTRVRGQIPMAEHRRL